MAARSGGDAREARRLAKQATILHAAPWLVAKAKRLLQGSDLPAASGSP
jgi:hypothetical protein